jgi:hypothetical protein
MTTSRINFPRFFHTNFHVESGRTFHFHPPYKGGMEKLCGCGMPCFWGGAKGGRDRTSPRLNTPPQAYDNTR